MTAPDVSRTDVLIVGAGPAGLLLATQLSKLNINFRIIDKAAHPVLRGHADGLQCRTGEVFHALGLGADFDKLSNECAEVVTYEQDENGDLHETGRVPDTMPGTSWARHVLLGQDKVESIFLRTMSENGTEVERLKFPSNIAVTEAELSNPTAYPISVTISRMKPKTQSTDYDISSGMHRSNLFAQEGSEQVSESESSETIQCKYLVGCDGARSFIRKWLGLEMRGDAANVYWGCFDALVKTDLPTIRLKNHINLREGEGVRMIPREGGLVRVYTQMGRSKPGERVNRSDVTVDKMLAKVQSALLPYRVDFPHVEWSSCYEVGQRMVDKFSSHNDHIIIAGDACHTHSPRAGQGMNISMMDTWNLGWKLAMVLKGLACPEILETYNSERREVARSLIDMHSQWNRITAELSVKSDAAEAARLAEDFRIAGRRAAKFVSGTGVVYPASSIVAQCTEEQNNLAKKVTVGSHFENQQVVCVANAHAIQLQKRLTGDGRWRIIIFTGDLRQASCHGIFMTLAKQLQSPDSFIKRYTPCTADIDSVLECLTVCTTPRLDVESQYLAWPAILRPARGIHGIPAFDTIFTDDASYHNGHGHAYEGYGISPQGGCILVTRPDQHVAGIFDLADYNGLDSFFSRFMLAQ